MKLDREALVAEYGRNMADTIIAEAERKANETETRPSKKDTEKR